MIDINTCPEHALVYVMVGPDAIRPKDQKGYRKQETENNTDRLAETY